MNAKLGRLPAVSIALACVLAAAGGLALKLHAKPKLAATLEPFDLIFGNLKFNGGRLDVQIGKNLWLFSQTTPKLSKPVAYTLKADPRAFCSGTRYAWLTDDKGVLTMLDLQTRATKDFPVPASQSVLGCDDTGSTAVLGAWSGEVAICRPSGLTWLRQAQSPSIGSVSISGDGKYCVAGTQDNLLIWRTDTQKLLTAKDQDPTLGGLSWDASSHSFWETEETHDVKQVDPTKNVPVNQDHPLTNYPMGVYNLHLLNRSQVALFSVVPSNDIPAPADGQFKITIDVTKPRYIVICRIHDKTILKKPSLSPAVALRTDGKQLAYISGNGTLTVEAIPKPALH